MEFFQSIWTLLNNENAELANIILLPTAFVDASIMMLLFMQLLNVKSSTKTKLAFVIALSITTLITGFLIGAPISSFINLFFYVFYVTIIFKLGPLKSMLATIISYAVYIIVAIITHNLYIHILNIPTDLIISVPIHKFLTSVLLYLGLFIVYFVAKHFNINIHLLDNFKKQINSVFIINFILGLAAFSIQLYISSFYTDIIPSYVTMLSLSILLIYFLFSLYSLFRTNNLERTKQDLEQSEQYNKTLTIMHDNIRAFRHDFSNILTTLGGYIQTDDLAGLKQYYSELLVDCNKTNNLSSLSPSVINEPAVYSLLTNKYYLADEKGITINLDVFIDLSKLNMKAYQFSRILRNSYG